MNRVFKRNLKVKIHMEHQIIMFWDGALKTAESEQGKRCGEI